MSKKTYKAIEVKEIKKYETSDGKIFDSKEEAENHEMELNDPESVIKRLEERVFKLEAEIAIFEARISCLENRKRFFPQPGVDPFQQPIIKFDKDSKKLPAEPGDIVY